MRCSALALTLALLALAPVSARADQGGDDGWRGGWVGGEVGAHLHAVRGNSAFGPVARITAGVARGRFDVAAAVGADLTFQVDEGSGRAAVAAAGAGVRLWSQGRFALRLGLELEGRRSTFHVDKDDLDDTSSDLALVPGVEATIARGRWRLGLAVRERVAVYDSFYGWWPGVDAMTYGDLPGESVTVTFRRAL